MTLRKTAGAAGATMGLAGASDAAAQSFRDRFFGDDDDGTDIASAGNGGVATASANGGAVAIGDINSGGNAGSAIGVGDTFGGPVAVDGGFISNLTDVGVSASGGTAIADASGGDYNLAFVS
ncbi:MAG: hypothetical protein ACRDJC_15265 [Thermomicrobiales bacterium]